MSQPNSTDLVGRPAPKFLYPALLGALLPLFLYGQSQVSGQPWFELLSAGVTHGPGAMPPPGAPPFKPRVAIAFRWNGTTPLKLSQLRADLVEKESSPMVRPAQKPRPLQLSGLRPADPLEPALWQVSAPWPEGSGKSWNLRLTLSRSGRVLAKAQCPINDFYLPAAPPSPAPKQHPSD